MTVVFTTSSPLDAARCDKVAVLAAGGHLAFYGTPAGACGYFGADSLEEIYERLAGLGDPAAAWSRRFLYFPRTTSGSTLVPTALHAPGPALLVPDLAGPHSAGRVSPRFASDLDACDGRDAYDGGDTGDGADAAPAPEDDALPSPRTSSAPQGPGRARSAGPLPPVRQLPVLIMRNAEVLARAKRQQAILAGAPVIVLLVFCVLLGGGALDGPVAVTLAWAVLGGLATGLAYELPARGQQAGVLRRERFAGLSTAAFL